MLPGAGHGPFGNIFDIAAYKLAGDGKRVFRVETWESREELEAQSLGELHEEVDAAVDYCRSNGCSTVDLTAKSFGGGVALSHDLDAVDDGDVTVIPGENHSFNENRMAVVEQTLRYLSTES